MRRLRLAALALIVTAMVSGCAAVEANRAPSIEKVDATEALLSQAGFRTLAADEPDELATVRGLPAFELHGYQGPAGAVFWYYDPRGCRCVWMGDAKAFEQYQWLMQQQHDIAQYTAETSPNDVTSLNALAPLWFPLPVYYYPIGFVGRPGDISGGGGSKGGGGKGGHGGGGWGSGKGGGYGSGGGHAGGSGGGHGGGSGGGHGGGSFGGGGDGGGHGGGGHAGGHGR
jgi:hypothetical protein